MILPDMQAVFGFDALVGDARPHHLGQAVDIDRVHVEIVLDFGAHGVSPRLGAENANLERARARIDLLGAEFVEDRQHVARRHGDDIRREVHDQLDLALGHPARDRNGDAAEFLGAVMDAEAAGEQTVAVGIVDLHPRPAAARHDAARTDIGPGADIELGVADDRRLAGRARRGMNAHHLVHRHREHPIGIVRAQIVLRRQRKLAQVGQVLQVVGMHARCIE